MSNPEDFPNVHAAYGVYMEYFNEPPTNATILVKWCKKQSIGGIKYANVNKYLRIRRNGNENIQKKKKPVIKSGTERYKANPIVEKNFSIKQLTSGFLSAMEESKKTRASNEFGFDKGQTKSTNFNTKYFEEKMKEDGENASLTHSNWKRKRDSFDETTDIMNNDETASFRMDTTDETASFRMDNTEEMKAPEIDESEIIEALGFDTELYSQLEEVDEVNIEMYEGTNQGIMYEKRTEPWHRLKLYWTPETRMSKESKQVEELKQWLESKKFGQFFDKLFEAGVESLADLRVLENEEEIMELAGPEGINMGVVFRRKFVKAITKLKSEEPTPITKQIEENPKTEPPEQSESGGKPSGGGGGGVSRPEKEALDSLVQSIKNLTVTLRSAKQQMGTIKQQADMARQDITDTFDKAMGILVMRRQQLESALDKAEEESKSQMKQKVVNLQHSAKALLTAKAKIEYKFKTVPNDESRHSTVKDDVSNALNTVPNDGDSAPNIIFDKGETDINEFLETFGSVGIGKTNESSGKDEEEEE